MKKLPILIFAAFMIFAAIPTQLMGTTQTIPIAIKATEPEDEEIANMLNARLNEIHGMDMSDLSRAEKRDLRKEVRAIERELKAQSRGVYISLGAIIIIIILLIIIL